MGRSKRRKNKKWKLLNGRLRHTFTKVTIVKWFEELGETYGLDSHGYIRDKKHVLVHRKNYEAAVGPIPDGWIVHHVDFDKLNNDPSNLIALPEAFHSEIHQRMKKLKQCWGRPKILAELQTYMQRFQVDFESLYNRQQELLKIYGAIFEEFSQIQAALSRHKGVEATVVRRGMEHVEILKSAILRSEPGMIFDGAPRTASSPELPKVYLKRQGKKSVKYLAGES